MVVIRIELWPGGSQHHHRRVVLAEAEIENIGGTRTSGDYRYRLYGKSRRLMKDGEVHGYKRIAAHTWVLIWMVLQDAFVSKSRHREI